MTTADGPKVHTPPEGCQSKASSPQPRGIGALGGGLRGRFLVLGLLLVTTLSGCSYFNIRREAPFDPEVQWTLPLGNLRNAPFEGERVRREQPEQVWEESVGRGLDALMVPAGPLLLTASTSRQIFARGLESGDEFWEHRKRGPIVTPVVVDGERLFVATADLSGRLYALRTVDGREEWERTVPGVAQPMTTADGILWLATETGSILAYDVEEGERLWERRLSRQAVTAPIPVSGGRLLVGTAADSLYLLDAASGDRRAAVPLPAEPTGPVAVAEGRALLPLHGGLTVALDLDRPGEELWRVETDASVLAPPIVDRAGTLFLLDQTGTLWRVGRVHEEGSPSARVLARLGSAATRSLTLAGDLLVVGLLDGRVVAVDAESGEELWTLRMPDSVNVPITVRDGALFVPLRRGQVVKFR